MPPAFLRNLLEDLSYHHHKGPLPSLWLRPDRLEINLIIQNLIGQNPQQIVPYHCPQQPLKMSQKFMRPCSCPAFSSRPLFGLCFGVLEGPRILNWTLDCFLLLPINCLHPDSRVPDHHLNGACVSLIRSYFRT